MILYIENPKDTTRKLLELINEFGRVAGYKINAQKSLAFLCNNDEKSESEIKKTLPLGFPGGAVVESLPANAGDAGSSPGLGRSHMPRSNWAHEPQLLSLRVWNLCSTTREAAIMRGLRTAMKSGPHLPQLEKALAQKRRPNTAINQSINQNPKKLKKKKKENTPIYHCNKKNRISRYKPT